MKKFLYIFFLICILTLSACKNDDKIKIEGSQIVEIGFSYEYKVMKKNEEMNQSNYYWIVDNSIVNLYDNVIIPNEIGKLTLKAISKEDGTEYTQIDIEVIDPIVLDLNIDCENNIIRVNEEVSIDYEVNPSDTTEEIKWTSSDNKIAKVDNGIVTALSAGTVTINAKCSSAESSMEFTVLPIITEVEVEYDNNIYLNEVTYLDINIDDAIISSNSDKINIDGNYIYAIKEGIATIHIESKSNPSLNKDISLTIINDSFENIITNEEQIIINSYMNDMTTKEKLGQMFLMNVCGNYLDYDDLGLYSYWKYGQTTRKKYYSEQIGDRIFSNCLINYENSFAKENISSIINYFQDMNKIGAIVAIDNNEYEYYNTLSDGFSKYYNNYTVGSCNDINAISDYFQYYANEISNSGINVVLQSAYMNANTVKGLFSQDKNKQIIYSSLLNNVLNINNVVLAPTFDIFDTNELIINEIYLDSAIKNNVNFISIYNNELFKSTQNINMSTYLREKGYEGIIYNEPTSYEEAYEDIISGVNMLGIDIYINLWGNNNEETLNIYDLLLENYDNDEQLKECIDSSVERILLFKIRNKIIDGTYPNEYFGVEKIDQSAITNIVKDDKTISTNKEFKGLDKNKPIYFFSTKHELKGNYIDNNRYIDIASRFSLLSIAKGYNKVYNCSFDINTYLEQIDYISDDEQVVFAIYEENIYYNDIDGVRYSIPWTDIIDLVKDKTNNIVIVLMDNPSIDSLYKKYNSIIIYANYTYDEYCTNVINVLDYGK